MADKKDKKKDIQDVPSYWGTPSEAYAAGLEPKVDARKKKKKDS